MDEMLERIIDCMGPGHGEGKKLADYLGVNPNVITNWKNGSNRSYRKYIKQIADYFGVTVDYLLTGEQKEKPAQELGEHLDFCGMRILATVRAGYGALAQEEDTGRCIGVSRDWLHGYDTQDCRALLVNGNSMYPTFRDGDIVIVHCQPDFEDNEVCVCIVDGEDGTVKRLYHKDGGVELRADNPQVPPRKIVGTELDEFKVYGKVIRLVRDEF